jgi:hypothetical protein
MSRNLDWKQLQLTSHSDWNLEERRILQQPMNEAAFSPTRTMATNDIGKSDDSRDDARLQRSRINLESTTCFEIDGARNVDEKGTAMPCAPSSVFAISSMLQNQGGPRLTDRDGVQRDEFFSASVHGTSHVHFKGSQRRLEALRRIAGRQHVWGSRAATKQVNNRGSMQEHKRRAESQRRFGVQIQGHVSR